MADSDDATTSDHDNPMSVGGSNIHTVEVEKDPTLKAQGYYDLLFVGLTGQGKTTTANKVLIANPTGINYQAKYPVLSLPRVDPKNQALITQDLHMWRIPNDEDAIERISTRMKNLANYRCLEEPHKEVNSARRDMLVNERTEVCELFSNETTKVRVLDVPGFFGERTAEDLRAGALRNRVHSTHLGTMRSILHIQTAMAMNFRRTLYFLPTRDELQLNAALQQELDLMFFYFGRPVFENMILVATFGPRAYRRIPEDQPVELDEDEAEESRKIFRKALKALIPDDTPNPPIIFISLRETCESILDKVKETEVRRDGLQLVLSSTVCAYCSMTIAERRKERIAAIGPSDERFIYEESHCHPILVPKYTTLQKIAKAAKKVVKRKPWKWGDFNVEECPNCNKQPGSLGCLRVGSQYSYNGETITVDHTNKVEFRGLFQNEDEVQQGGDDSDGAESGSESGDDRGDSSEVLSVPRRQLISRAQPDHTLRQNVLDSQGAAFGRSGESYQDIFSSGSEGFYTKEVAVDIEPQPEDSLGSARLREEGGAHNFPEIEEASNDSGKKGT